MKSRFFPLFLFSLVLSLAATAAVVLWQKRRQKLAGR